MNHIREIRIKRGMTQVELAAKCKSADPTIDQARISFLENGDVYPGENLMAALCEALEVPEELIYDGVEAVFIPVAEVPHSEATMILANTLKWGKKYAMTRTAEGTISLRRGKRRKPFIGRTKTGQCQSSASRSTSGRR